MLRSVFGEHLLVQMATRKAHSQPLVQHRPPHQHGRRNTAPVLVSETPLSEHSRLKVNLIWSVERKKGSSHRLNDVCFMEDGRVAVAEKKKSRICLYDINGKETLVIDREKDPGLLEPSTLLPQSEGDILLATDLNQIKYFSPEGHCVDFWEPKRRKTSVSDKLHADTYCCLHGVTLTRDNDFVVSDISCSPSVGIFSPQTGKLKRALKLPAGETWRKPYYVTTHPKHGQIYVSDCENHCVYAFDTRQGRYIHKLGADRSLLYPLGIDIGPKEEVWVCDQVNDRISGYDIHAGKSRGPMLTSEDGIQKPVGIRCSKDKTSFAVTEDCLDHKHDKNALKIFQIMSGERRHTSADATAPASRATCREPSGRPPHRKRS